MHRQDPFTQRWHHGVESAFLKAKLRLVPRLAGLLALIIVSAGQPLVTQAQQITQVDYDLVIGGPPGNICFHENVQYPVHVIRKIQIQGDKGSSPGISGVDIEANIVDPTLITYGSSQLLHAALSDPDEVEPFAVYFSMNAQNKTGSTTITFTATLHTTPVSVVSKAVPVNVVSCKVKVSWSNNWGPIFQGTGGSVGIAGTFSDAILTADAKGHYTSDNVQASWQPSVVLPSACAPHDGIQSSDVNIQGDIDKNGLLNLTLTFKGTTLNEFHACGNKHTTSNPLAIQQVKVPPLPFERTSKKVPQNLKAAGFTLVGSALVSVSVDKGD